MENKELENIISEYMQIWSAGREDILDKLAHENLEVDYTHFENPIRGISDYKEMLKTTYNYFPDLKIHLDKIVTNRGENKVTVRWEYSGTHENGNLFGVNSTGKKVSVKGVSLLQIENNLITKEEGIVDNLSLIMQLGVL